MVSTYPAFTLDRQILERIVLNITTSIIILNYRSLGYVTDCVNSINRHPPKDSYEIIVVDNDSQDGKFDYFCNKYSHIKCIKNSGNYGYSSGSNLGAKNARGKYLVFLNPDTELTSSPAIDTMVEYARKNKDTGIISCRKIKPGHKLEREVTFINPWLTLGIVRSLYKKIFKNTIEEKLPKNADIWHPEWLTGSVFFVSSDIYNQIGGLSEKDYWMYFEEMDLAHKINQINKTITLIRNVEIKHQHGGSSRANPETSAITKSEVMISRHVYIQKFYSGINLYLLHIYMLSISLNSQLIMALISFPFAWTNRGRASLLLLSASIQYYFHAFIDKSWKSSRLKGE
jgi:GT2 family glycosyltransferase